MENSPFARLPIELTREIFQFCLPPENPSFKSSNAPLLLTHICRTWRTIASGTPHLWSHIVVPRWKEAVVGVDQLTELWISRTQNAPLTIDVGLFSGRNERAYDNTKLIDELYALMRRLLASLAPHRARVRSFWGVVPTSFTLDVGIPDMVNVERIFFYGLPKHDEVLRIIEGETPRNALVKLDMGSAKDKLRVLSVCDCAVDINSVMLQTKLTHLELFDLDRDSGLCQETALGLLRNMPDLQKCVLELTQCERFDWNPASSTRMVLSNLELLFFLWNFPADIGILLDSISAPNLIRLGLRGTPTMGHRAWNGLCNFLHVSHAPLTRMSLGSFGDADLRLLDCLKCCPRLVQLSLNHCFVPDEVFRSLARIDYHLLPRLETLNMVACAGIKADTVAAFFKSRTHGVPPGFSRLREVEIVNCLNVTEHHLPLLRQCGVEKLHLKVTGDYLV